MHLSFLGSFIKPKPSTNSSFTQSFTQVSLGDKYFPNFSMQLSKHIYFSPYLLLYLLYIGHSSRFLGKHSFVS